MSERVPDVSPRCITIRYLATKYGAESKLYPTDAETRAKVDQRLYFDMGVFYKVCQAENQS